MANTDKSVNASKLREPIPESAARIAGAENPKKIRPEKRLPSLASHGKRPASTAFELSTDTEEITKPNPVDAFTRPVKQLKLQGSNHNSGPLADAAPSRVNIISSKLQKESKQTRGRSEDEAVAANTLAELKHSHSFFYPSGVPFVSHEDTGPIGPGEGSGLTSSQRRQDLQREPSTPTASKLPAASAATSYIDGMNYLHDDDSDLRHLPDPPSSSTNTSNQNQSPQPAGSGIMRHSKMSLDFITTPTPAASSRVSGFMTSSAPTSAPHTPLSGLPPFIPADQAEDMGPTLPAAPSLRAESRSPTCFRMYQLYRLQAAQASTTATVLKVELFAAVVQSVRRRDDQFFRFADLFYRHQPPQLTGSYEGSLASNYNDVDTQSVFTDTISDRGPRGGKITTQKYMKLLSNTPSEICRAVIQLEPTSPIHIVPRPQPTDVKILHVQLATAEEIAYLRGIIELEQPLEPKEIEEFDASKSQGRWNYGQKEVDDRKTAKEE